MINPLTRCVQEYQLPPYATMRASDIAPAIRTAIDELELDLAAIEDDLADSDAELSWESVMDRLEIIDDPLSRLWGVVELLSLADNSPDVRAAEAELQGEIAAIESRRQQSAEIFRAMEALRASPTFVTYTAEQQRILNRAILKATLRGVRLSESDRDTFNEIDVRLKEAESQFANTVLDATCAFSLIVHDKRELDGVPESALSLFAHIAVAAGHDGATAAAGPWRLSLERPAYDPIMKYCTNRTLREQIYRANNSRGGAPPHDNTSRVREILQLRHKRAQLFGFDTYAELSLVDKMAPSVDVVETVLRDLREKSFPVAQVELQRLEDYAIRFGHTGPMERWDESYWRERLRKEAYDLDEEELKPYLPLAKVLEGLFETILRLFGLRIEAADGDEEVWHPDVRFFQIRATEQPGEPIVGHFFLDLYARQGLKRHGSWVRVMEARSKTLRTDKAPVRLPAFCILCNQAPKVGDEPSLLTFGDVEYLFHQFGYGLKLVCTAAEYSAAANWDTIEWDCISMVPHFLQNFCYDRRTMELISSHFESGAPLPEALFDKVKASRQYMAASDLLRQLNFAMVDMALHHRYDPYSTTESIFDVQQRVAKEFCVIPPLESDRQLCVFNHIFAGPYCAGYYSYKWAEVQSADAYAAFEEAPTREAWEATGRKFRDTVLALVGIHHPSDVFEMFRGRQPNTNALLTRYGLVESP
ncbi:Aste57867_22226 [Aphanomyces stellatus]|uniref:oligopeptidase A n=1 Tax=Aphanomyces stellatus TaxID=120398 RepID=A0A485LJL4_9STRA|nr:hypothetical protein As57867_022157 [Aphanomyces stellatus]VFT98893.1 Aste57867_22226 [Aphanomyces stellatus]